jgi:glyoxylase-like metal-dependent hydrolase (beta-lactamase superfamily II)
MDYFNLRPVMADRLWAAEMPFHPPGFDVGARMTLVRLSDGGLFVHSPIGLTPDLKRQLDALGPVRFIVCPFRMHTAHLREFAEAYPDAPLYAPPGLKPKETTRGLDFAGVLGDMPEPGWAGDLDQALFLGNKLDDEVVFFHPSTRTLILTDLCFNVPSSRGFATSLVAGLLGVRDRLSPSRTIKLMTKDREASRASVRRMLEWDFDRVILSHGNIVETGGKAAFREAFRWLLNDRP